MSPEASTHASAMIKEPDLATTEATIFSGKAYERLSITISITASSSMKPSLYPQLRFSLGPFMNMT
jgi:hypothetical protein